jgi:hypothetical protein
MGREISRPPKLHRAEGAGAAQWGGAKRGRGKASGSASLSSSAAEHRERLPLEKLNGVSRPFGGCERRERPPNGLRYPQVHGIWITSL